jgi:D-inositol-3-phosphate glycosyltransferase
VVLGTSFANETFGMTLAEASACARPVIATDFGGFPEVVRDGETGLLVPPRDPARLAAAIDTIIRDPDDAARMGAAGRAFVAAEFAWPTVTARVIAAYEEALGAH